MLWHGGLTSGTAGSGLTPAGGAEKAGPGSGDGFKVMVIYSVDAWPPEVDGDIVTEIVRVEGVGASCPSAAGFASADADA